MSLVKFNTMGAETKGGNNTLWIILGLGVVGYLGYKYWYLPRQEAKKAASSPKP